MGDGDFNFNSSQICGNNTSNKIRIFQSQVIILDFLLSVHQSKIYSLQ